MSYNDNFGSENDQNAYPYYPQSDQSYYTDQYQDQYQDQYPDQALASETSAVTTARQQRMKLLGIVLVVVIVLVTVVVKSAGPKQPAKSGNPAQLKAELPGEVFQNFHFQLPEAWKALEAEKPEEADFTRSYVPQKASKGEMFTIYTPGPSQQTQAALAKLSEEEILTSYLEAVQQDSQIHEFSKLEDSYPLGLPHRSYSYKFSQAPDLAYVVNTVVLREGQLFVFQTAAEESQQAWVETTHGEILQSLKQG